MRKLEPGNIDQRLKKAGIDTDLKKRLKDAEPHRARAQMLERDLGELNGFLHSKYGSYVIAFAYDK
jgi:hypothetical protein